MTQTDTQARSQWAAKAEILARIRLALGDVPDASAEQDVPVAWE